MKKILISLGSVITLTTPALVLAAGPKLDGYLNTLITQGTSLLKSLLVFLISLAVVWFIWNVIKYAMSEEEDGKEKAKQQMIWGIIAMAVIVSIWGIVALLQTAFGTGGGNSNSFDFDGMIPGGADSNSVWDEGTGGYVSPDSEF